MKGCGEMQLNDKITKMIIGQGIFAVLFVGLLLYVIKENTKTKTFLQQTIVHRLDDLDVMQEKINKLSQDNADIKNLIIAERKDKGE